MCVYVCVCLCACVRVNMCAYTCVYVCRNMCLYRRSTNSDTRRRCWNTHPHSMLITTLYSTHELSNDGRNTFHCLCRKGLKLHTIISSKVFGHRFGTSYGNRPDTNRALQNRTHNTLPALLGSAGKLYLQAKERYVCTSVYACTVNASHSNLCLFCYFVLSLANHGSYSAFCYVITT